MKKIFIILFLFLSKPGFTQQTELFASFQTGNPFKFIRDEGPLMWNYSFGVERYLAEKLSVSFSYRKAFYLVGKEAQRDEKSIEFGSYRYHYTEYYNSFGFDIESKFFFDAPDEGAYMGSGISMQPIKVDLTFISIEDRNYSFPSSEVPYFLNSHYSDKFTIYPLKLILGRRASGDVMVFDYYFTCTYFLGANNVIRFNDNIIDYYSLKSFVITMGIKWGFKI